MRYVRLGGSGLQVSALGLGCMGFGPRERWFGGADERQAAAMVGRALDAGVNLFDTADVYNIGHSEEILGRALGPRRREALVATKAFCRMGPLPNDAGLSRHHLIEACEASLRRLKTDVIDLYQLHEWDPGTPIEETLRALEDLRRWGKIRYAGCSNFAAWQHARALWAADKNGWPRLETNQVLYNLLDRSAERELAPLAEDQSLGLLCYSPLAGGWLSGKYTGGASGRHASAESSYPFVDGRRAAPVLKILSKVAEALGRSPAQVALAWLAARPRVNSVIFGSTGLAQLEENLGAAELNLSPDVTALLDRASALSLP